MLGVSTSDPEFVTVMATLISIALFVSLVLYLAGKGRKRKQQYYNSLDTNEKILYHLEEVNNKTPGPLEELVWGMFGIVFGLWLAWFTVYSIFN